LQSLAAMNASAPEEIKRPGRRRKVRDSIRTMPWGGEKTQTSANAFGLPLRSLNGSDLRHSAKGNGRPTVRTSGPRERNVLLSKWGRTLPHSPEKKNRVGKLQIPLLSSGGLEKN